MSETLLMTKTDENDDTDAKPSPPDEQVLDLSFKSKKAPTEDNSSPQEAQKNSSNKRKKKPTKTHHNDATSLNESNQSSNSSGDEIETDLDNNNEEEPDLGGGNVENDELNCDTTSADNYYEYNEDYDEPNHEQFGNESEIAEPEVEYDSFKANKAKKPEPKVTVNTKTVNKIQPPLAPPPQTVSSSSSSSSSSSKKQMRFQCCFCVYKSHSVSLMQNHIYRHIDTTPYSCFYCGHKSTTKSTIMVHIELCHPNMEVKIKESRVKEEDYYLDLNAASSAPATNAQFSLKDGKSNTVSSNSGSNKFEIIANKCQGSLEDEAANNGTNKSPNSLSSPSVLSPLISSNSSMCSSPSISPAPNNQNGKSGGQHHGKQAEVESNVDQFSLESQLKANHSFDGRLLLFFFFNF